MSYEKRLDLYHRESDSSAHSQPRSRYAVERSYCKADKSRFPGSYADIARVSEGMNCLKYEGILRKCKWSSYPYSKWHLPSDTCRRKKLRCQAEREKICQRCQVSNSLYTFDKSILPTLPTTSRLQFGLTSGQYMLKRSGGAPWWEGPPCIRDSELGMQ
ncbi:hypothetical protein BDV28DRAFT_22487 [Aspergillus coremiiformis]|uniref:Zn(2)-C6 fungal-type domain-containing protein n=1 Tax=Aspergillus coremiiformis TaxID=138285 RepID=A0A5N6Z1L5_9EURO|nr:hypothetical protein BDV28DRAFT_22487 [Aspergillus coremiiformis]